MLSSHAGNRMTALPRNAPLDPVGDGVRRNTHAIRDRLVSAEAGNEFFDHGALSQIVSGNASPYYHNLCVADSRGSAHDAGMDTQEKNGGPNYLREWRTFRHLSQAALAERVGANPNMIQYLETGERGLSAKWLRKLAPALETTPGMLLDHDPHELDADILDIWGNASAREKRQISEVARALLKTGTG